jgi:hypothetical protein
MKLCSFVFTALMLAPTLALAHPSNHPDPVGLSLFFRNGEMAPIQLVDGPTRYLQELDILEEKVTTTDEGIEPIIEDSDLSNLDWTGISMVEENWRPDVDGTYIRQRFYRNARWMERASLFILFPTNDYGDIVGQPIWAYAGKDNQLTNADDEFIRRFNARQITKGCPAINDCTGATSFTAQGLIQLRQARQPNQRDHLIPKQATQLSLLWTEDIFNTRSVYVDHHDASEFAFGYGLEVSLEEVTTPANGQYYVPGDTVSFQVTFRDHEGNRLHSEGSLPTFGQFLRGEASNGLRYFDFAIPSTLFYALKHRESNELLGLIGPVDKLKVSKTVTNIFDFLGPQVTTATVTTDGYSGVVAAIPPASIVLLTGTIPGIEDTPVSDVVSLVIPTDALPGTYLASVKMRRDWGGEALNRSETAKIQVGSATTTVYLSKTGKCNSCHNGNAAIGEVLHGLGDRSACYTCHNGLSTEPDNFLDIRIHTIHDRSDRFAGKVTTCATCHLTPPPGPARGILNLPE